VSFGDLVGILWGMPGVAEAILVGLVAAVLVARPLARRLGGPAVLAGLTVAAQVVLLAVTLVPDLGSGAISGAGPGDPLLPVSWAGSWSSIGRCVTGWDGALSLATTSLDGQANIVLFAGVAVVATAWVRRPVMVAAVLSGESAVIELVQAVFAGSSCQPSDWLANTSGSVLGAVVAALAVAWWHRMHPREGRA
jgi:hypothetical protein